MRHLVWSGEQLGSYDQISIFYVNYDQIIVSNQVILTVTFLKTHTNLNVLGRRSSHVNTFVCLFSHSRTSLTERCCKIKFQFDCLVPTTLEYTGYFFFLKFILYSIPDRDCQQFFSSLSKDIDFLARIRGGNFNFVSLIWY